MLSCSLLVASSMLDKDTQAYMGSYKSLSGMPIWNAFGAVSVFGHNITPYYPVI